MDVSSLDPGLLAWMKAETEWIAIESAALAELKTEHVERTKELDRRQAALAEAIIEAGLEKLPLDNGLCPRPTIKVEYYASGKRLDDQDVIQFAEDAIPGSSKVTLHKSALQRVCEQVLAAGGYLPDWVTTVEKPRVTMYGKSKFLNSRGTK